MTLTTYVRIVHVTQIGKSRKAHFIDETKTLEPYGLNKRQKYVNCDHVAECSPEKGCLR